MDWDFPKIKINNDIAMTREEAIKIVSNIYQTDKEKEALGVLIPELADSEDERARKELILYFNSQDIAQQYVTDEKRERWVSYLEKLKEQKPVEIEEIIRKAKSEGRQEVIDNPEYYQLQKPAEQVEINKSLTEAVIAELGKYNGENHLKSPWAIDSTGLQYPLHFANLGATWQKEQKPSWSEEDKQWLSEVYFAIDHSMYSEDEKQAMKKYIDSLRSQSKLAEWSDEDEKNSAFIVAALDAYARLRKEKNNTSGQEDFDKAVSWIHDRLGFIRPQTKPEWSENSRKRLETIADYLRYKGYEDDADFIESIPPQQKEEGIKGVKGHPDPAGVWIPSDGQLKALKYFLAQHRLQMDASTTKWEEYDNLRSLYDILCKIAKS